MPLFPVSLLVNVLVHLNVSPSGLDADQLVSAIVAVMFADDEVSSVISTDRVTITLSPGLRESFESPASHDEESSAATEYDIAPNDGPVVSGGV